MEGARRAGAESGRITQPVHETVADVYPIRGTDKTVLEDLDGLEQALLDIRRYGQYDYATLSSFVYVVEKILKAVQCLVKTSSHRLEALEMSVADLQLE